MSIARDLEEAAPRSIAAALPQGGRLFIDGGNPLREVALAGAASRSSPSPPRKRGPRKDGT